MCVSGLAGKTVEEEARADMVVDSVEEMLKPLFQLMFYAPEDQKVKHVCMYIQILLYTPCTSI